MQIRLILLDFDGTLADTRRANTLAYVATLREAGYTLTEEEYAAKYFGMRCNEFLTRYGIADPGERERLRLRKIALYPAFFDTVRLNRPLWEFCRQFRAQGGRVWIVSTGSRANIDNAMRHLGITVAGQRTGSTGAATSGAAGRDLTGADEAWLRTAGTATIDAGTPAHATGIPEPGEGPNGSVDGILSGADVEHSKPAPDCFLEAMRREGCTPQETLIFEDSEIGLEAARRSGLFQGNALTIAAQAVPGILYPASGTRHPASGTRHPAPCILYPVFCILRPAPRTRHPAPAAGRTHSSAPSPTASIRPIFHNRPLNLRE